MNAHTVLIVLAIFLAIFSMFRGGLYVLAIAVILLAAALLYPH